MKQDIQLIFTKLFEDAVAHLDWPSVPVHLDFPTDPRFGDLSTNIALRLGKLVKKSPAEVGRLLAERVREGLEGAGCGHLVKEVKVEGAGFINAYLSDAYFYDFLADLLAQGKELFRKPADASRKTLIEFVSANPTGSLSVAHARQAAVGDALASILDFSGIPVQREYYLNDEGNQINILGRSIELRMRELKGEQVVFPEDHYQGQYIYDIARQAMEKEAAPGQLAEFGVEYLLGLIRKELDDFGVAFDSWFSQKELTASGKIEEAFRSLKEQGFLYEQEGALWFKSTQFGDDKDRVVVKSDGSYTYLAPDIAYHQEKYRRGFRWLVNLWGPDHHGYIPRLKASVAAFGRDPESLTVVIVQLATIFRQGTPVQMSTRKGQYITLREVLDEVGRDAARFFFLMRRTSSHLDFDLEIAKKQSPENPVYYVQYAHARICGILSNTTAPLQTPGAPLPLLKEKEELRLIKKLWQFPATLSTCVSTVDPYMLTVYLQELSEGFHRFYDLHRVLGQEDALTRARLSLLTATKTVIAAGLELLGVSHPEKM